MRIELQYFEGCSNWRLADDRLRVLAAERSDIQVTHRVVATVEDAERVGFHGSPSVLVDGVDVFAGKDIAVGLACRVYDTPDGPAGAPTLDQLRAASTVA
jgi:hypothetical protein